MSVLNGKKMRDIREKRGMTPTQLAAAVGVSAQAINRFEAGAKDPSLRLLKIIAQVLCVNVSELM